MHHVLEEPTTLAGYNARLIEKLTSIKRRFAIHKNQVFVNSRGVINALVPAAEASSLTPSECQRLFNCLGGSIVRWTSGFSEPDLRTEWYCVICRNFVSLDEMTHNKRYKINRSLKHFEARRINARELAQIAYPVYLKALSRYKGTSVNILSREAFESNVSREDRFPDLVDNWGLFLKGSNIIVGYSQNQLLGDVEVNYSSVKLDPFYFKNRPGYALIYKMNEYYLGTRGFGYANDGYRSIYHKTHFQQSLVNDLGFERAYTKLYVNYRQLLRPFVNFAYVFRNVLRRLDSRFNAVLEQERCRRSFYIPTSE